MTPRRSPHGHFGRPEWMNARFAGTCRCGASFEKGAVITYDRRIRQVTACPTCSDKRAEGALADQFDRDFEDQCAAACGPGLADP